MRSDESHSDGREAGRSRKSNVRFDNADEPVPLDRKDIPSTIDPRGRRTTARGWVRGATSVGYRNVPRPQKFGKVIDNRRPRAAAKGKIASFGQPPSTTEMGRKSVDRSSQCFTLDRRRGTQSARCTIARDLSALAPPDRLGDAGLLIQPGARLLPDHRAGGEDSSIALTSLSVAASAAHRLGSERRPAISALGPLPVKELAAAGKLLSRDDTGAGHEDTATLHAELRTSYF